MYCPDCGKQISEESNFCQYCGYSFKQKKKRGKDNVQPEWEYEDCVINWPEDKLPSGKFGIMMSESQIKATFWDWYQQDILIRYQKTLDQGWEPISQVGPSALKIINHKAKGFFDVTRTSTQNVMDLLEFRVAMRRRKK